MSETKLSEREPVMLGAGVAAVIEAAIATLVIFEVVDWTTEQTAILMGLVAATVTLVGGWYGRSRAFSTATADRMADEAADLELGLMEGEYSEDYNDNFRYEDDDNVDDLDDDDFDDEDDPMIHPEPEDTTATRV